MKIKQLREALGLSQRELASMTGINYRSLQDYEQGHKRLSSASGDTLLRLSLALGCSVSELLFQEQMLVGAPLHAANTLTAQEIQGRTVYCNKYRVAGQWVCVGNQVSLVFCYAGEICRLPFDAVFSPRVMPFLPSAAEIMIEDYIEAKEFQLLVERRMGGEEIG